jgi:hypothetical protein
LLDPTDRSAKILVIAVIPIGEEPEGGLIFHHEPEIGLQASLDEVTRPLGTGRDIGERRQQFIGEGIDELKIQSSL